MGRLLLIVVFVALVLAGISMLLRGIGYAAGRLDRKEGVFMAGDGMLPKLAYGLLIALIVYVTLTASGA